MAQKTKREQMAKTVVTQTASFGVRLKHFRQLVKAKPEEFADSLGISKEKLSLIENGKISFNATRKNLFPLYNIYGLNRDWIISGIGLTFAKKTLRVKPEVFDTATLLSAKGAPVNVILMMTKSKEMDAVGRAAQAFSDTVKTAFLNLDDTCMI